MNSIENGCLPDLTFLSSAHLRSALTTLGHARNGLQVAFLKACLAGLGLKNIDLLKTYEHLQEIDLSENSLSSLVALSKLDNLLVLRCSHNLLKEAAVYLSLSKQLEVLELAFNQIEKLESFNTHFPSLRELNLSNNFITTLSTGGISNSFNLRILNLNNNKLLDLSGLTGLVNLEELYISHNQIHDARGICKLEALSILDISHNAITDLSPLSKLNRLHSLRLEGNCIQTIQQLHALRHLTLLRSVSILPNPLFLKFQEDVATSRDANGDNSTGSTKKLLPDSKSNVNHFLGDIVQPDSSAAAYPMIKPIVEKSAPNMNVRSVKSKNAPITIQTATFCATPPTLPPESEDRLVKSKIDVAILFRWNIICILPQLWSLDDAEINVETKAEGLNLQGGEGRNVRKEIYWKHFGNSDDT